VPGGEPALARGGPGLARGLRAAAALGAALALALGLSSCANSDGLALARKACALVDRSLSLYRSAQEAPGTPRAAAEQSEALNELHAALPIAATAAGEASQWQALMTTLSDSTRMSESTLVYALSAQCSVADGNGEEPQPSTATSSGSY